MLKILIQCAAIIYTQSNRMIHSLSTSEYYKDKTNAKTTRQRPSFETIFHNKEQQELKFMILLITRLNDKLSHHPRAEKDTFEAILRAFEPYAKGSKLMPVEEKIQFFRQKILDNYEHFQSDAHCLYLVYKYHEALFSHGVVIEGPMQNASDCLLRAAGLKHADAMGDLARLILRASSMR